MIRRHQRIKSVLPALVLACTLAIGICFYDTAALAAADETSDDSPKMTIAQCQRRISHHFSKKIIAEAYRKIGIQADFVEMPCRRAIELVNRGVYDGEVGKVPGTSLSFPNLIAVESPIFMIEGVALTKSVSRKIENWSDLQGLRIGIESGQLFAEQGTMGMKPIVVSNFSQLVSLLAIDRIDIAIALRQDYELLDRTIVPQNSEIHIIGKPLFTAPLFHLIHKKHKKLLPSLTETLSTMWKTGETDVIHQKTLHDLKEPSSLD